jgi:hypothetical protein
MRALYIAGGFADGHYSLETRPLPVPAAHLGDTRHAIALRQVGPSMYRWDTNVDFALGEITAAQTSALISALLRAPAGRTDRELLDDLHGAFPHASAAFGRGFSIDSLRTAPGPGGTTAVALTIGFHPDDMRPALPALAGYLDKYLRPAKYHLALHDRSGAALFDVDGRDRAIVMHYRVTPAGLVTLAGPPRPWPDSLELTSDVTVKIKLFTVGFHDLVTDFVIDDAGHDRSWTIVARHEPQWSLPLITERLIRTPLHHPFEGEGALFRLSVRDSAGTQTLLGRQARLDVQESPVIRFLGSLGAHALGDLNDNVQRDEDRYLREGFAALDADLHTLGGRWRGAGPE